MPIKLLQTIHLGVGFVNAYVAASVGEVGVLERAEKILSKDRSARSEMRKGPRDV